MGRDPSLRSIEKWKIQDSVDLYNIHNWGKGYLSINDKGNVTVHPEKNPARAVDLKSLMDDLQERGISAPVLLRFPGVLKHRLEDIRSSFDNAIREFDYEGKYVCIYPIKVNQQSHVVSEYLSYGIPLGFGIEAGSKPELLAVMGLVDNNETPIVCNGFKDDEFIEAVILTSKIGKTIIPIVEKWTELELIVKYAQKHNVRPRIGVRVKLASRGVGRWESSAGIRSKFGLTIPELLRAVEFLKARNMEDCLQLLHFHMGSQVSNIRNIKAAITEAARIYSELRLLGAGLKYLDVGGGLGVDYDGSQTNFESSINYTLQEYANDVVFRIKTVCEEAGVPHPTIMSESGRAIISYHSLLIMNVLGRSGYEEAKAEHYEKPDEEDPQPLHDLYEIHTQFSPKNYLENYHDASQAREEAINLFNLGYMSLAGRAEAESLFWAICEKVKKVAAEDPHMPEELEGLDEILADTYFCNFSLFQSMPDSWAIGQLFPVMPIHRLAEEPTRRATIADITCDSDGKIDEFIDTREVKKTLELHPFDGSAYYLGVFLIGAYQEILGDLHNLLGDTNTVHVSLDEHGEVVLDHIIEGDTVSEVLSYVQYEPKDMIQKFRRETEKAARDKRITLQESTLLLRFYIDGMNGYTYLEEPQQPSILAQATMPSFTNGHGNSTSTN
ncbi:biosynthetic arginine decarboxylase [bacterium]|nr:biosynthetic arginine decarboxylase [bacterium]